MKIIDASKLIKWVESNNHKDDGGQYVDMFPLLDYISEAENRRDHGHGKYAREIEKRFDNPELLIIYVDDTEYVLLNKKAFDVTYFDFRKRERDARRIARKAGKL